MAIRVAFSRGVVAYFRLLAVIAILLLWGVSLANGTVKALLLAVFHGEINKGVPLRRSYLGFLPLDLVIALLVAFFFYGTNSHDEGYQLFLVDAYSTLQSAFVWLYMEAKRPGDKPYLVSRPIIFGILWQCFGAAIALPLYFAAHLPWAMNGRAARVRDVAQAAAVPWSFSIGAILPAVVGMGTTWLGADSRTDATHQLILGLWQPDPVWVSGVQAVVSMIISAVRPGRGRGQKSKSSSGPSRRDQAVDAYLWVRFSYLLAAVMSGAGHLYVMGRIFTSNEKNTVAFIRMYVPFLFSGPSGVGENVLVYGPWLFLQYDLIIISLSSLSWVYYLLTSRGDRVPPVSACRCFLLLSFGALTIGPGATVSIALWYRESTLAEYVSA
ncbi:uncharacterized protein CTRU02_215371 [Colletotrichum truncatum]|uniref:Uncharacterized protein n=1 Tax=Colletotrichum truncatum TaxID=5467 RepID=A0ACC3YD34_COLTU|nr:uncharacterized protein CTRU02_13328 [Colletotrichum truncatum]KAF6783565.1 hypothetical protein CTRU02_13328 [Colletotrichum truncatum]